MLLVEGGEFLMGSTDEDTDAYDREKPAHQVRLSSFYIGKFPVTQELWEIVVGKNPSSFKGSRRPVEQVSWDDAQGFIKKLNALTKRQYRLPTEAEWEYAARGGALSEGYQFAGSDKLKQVGWYDENSNSETHDVGQKYPNELGLYDMSGNVFEWCNDWCGENYYKLCHNKGLQENPQGAESAYSRVFRGGGWRYDARICRTVCRNGLGFGYVDFFVGFRLVLSLQSVG